MKELISAQLADQLPILRALARMAISDKDHADDCIAAAMEDLISQVSSGVIEPRSDLGNRMVRLTEKVLARRANGRFDRTAWRALILVHIDQISLREAAKILGVQYETIKYLEERLLK